jgi:hypothetical protein
MFRKHIHRRVQARAIMAATASTLAVMAIAAEMPLDRA